MKKFLIYIIGLITFNGIYAQIVNIPDPNFKNALVNTPCVIFGPPGDCSDVNESVDINGDGEVQVAEAEAVDLLCIDYQNITSLEGLEAFVNLETLSVFNNDLTTIDTSHNLLLKTLDCGSNRLTSTNFNTTLEVLNVSYNELTDLDISGNSSLISLSCKYNQLSSIDISNNINLLGISIGFNGLTTLDLSQHPNFGSLSIQNNQLTSIDVTNNPMLKNLNIGNNSLSTLNLSQNPLLERVLINDNNLNIIDVTNNPLLESLFIGGNNISSFDVSNNVLLETLSFSNSPLINGYIDLSQQSVLWSLRCENTSISGLNIRNGTPTLPNQLEAYNNPHLFCIDVDDPENIGNDWEVDEQVYLSEDCQLGVQDFDAAKIVITPNPVKDSITFSTNLELRLLKIYNLQGKLLYKKENPNHTLNLSSLASGLLFLQFTTDEGVITKKIIKK